MRHKSAPGGRSARTRTSRLAAAGSLLLASAAATSGCVDQDVSEEPGAPASSAEASPSSSSAPERSAAASSAPTSVAAPSTAAAEILPLPRGQWARMKAAGMVRPECPVQDRSQLRVVEVNHYDFDGAIERGRIVVNADVANSVARIFTRIFEAEFPIEQMTPVERFDGDTNVSLRANNTSAFNCRRADQINAPFTASPHANGRAIDINPLQNPWMDLRCDCWLPSAKYHKRVEAPGRINQGGTVWKLFRDEGWIWQNIDVPDYMHFDTGYPSRPFTG
jgi:hypothetical protein